MRRAATGVMYGCGNVLRAVMYGARMAGEARCEERAVSEVSATHSVPGPFKALMVTEDARAIASKVRPQRL